MGHSDIRGLATAFHLFLAGLPRSRSWDHHVDARIKLVEGSPHRSRASRCRFGVEAFGWEAGSVSHLLLGRLGMRLIGSGGDLHLPCDIPDKAGELAGDRHAALALSHLSPCVQFAKPVGESKLRFPGDIADGFGLTFLAHLDGAANSGVEAVGPGRLDEDASGVFVSHFGNGALAASIAGGELRGDQSQVLHQCLRMSKAGQVSDLSDEGDRRGEIHATQTHQGVDHAFHAPVLILLAKGLGESLYALVRVLDGLTILIEGDLLSRVVELDAGQVPLVCGRPGGLAVIGAAMAQQHGFELQACPQPSGGGVLSCAGEVADGLIALIRHSHLDEVAGTGLPCKKHRIEPIGLEALLDGLLLKVRIVRAHVALYPMAVETMFAPNPDHHHMADPQLRSPLAGCPVRRASRCVPRALQNLRLQLRGEDRGNLANVAAVEPCNALLRKSLAPAGHEASTELDPLRGLIPRMAFCQEQDQPGLSGILGPICPAVVSPSQFDTRRVRQGDGVCHERHYSRQMDV